MNLREFNVFELYSILIQIQIECWGHISMVFAFHHAKFLGSNSYHWNKQIETKKNVESQMWGRFYHLLILLFFKDLFFIYLHVCVSTGRPWRKGQDEWGGGDMCSWRSGESIRSCRAKIIGSCLWTTSSGC